MALARPAGLMVLTLRGDRISGLTRFHDNDALHRCGLLDAAPIPTAGRSG